MSLTTPHTHPPYGVPFEEVALRQHVADSHSGWIPGNGIGAHAVRAMHTADHKAHDHRMPDWAPVVGPVPQHDGETVDTMLRAAASMESAHPEGHPRHQMWARLAHTVMLAAPALGNHEMAKEAATGLVHGLRAVSALYLDSLGEQRADEAGG